MYTAWWQHTQEASPIVRPSWWYGLEASAHITDHVYIGDHLWYAPRLKMSQINFQKDLPKGIWYHYFTKRQVLSNTLTQLPNLIPTANQTAYQSMALFVRAGSVIPTKEISDYLNSKESKELSLNVFAGASATSYLYEDDGSYSTDSKTSRVLQFKTENHSKGFRITATQTGEYPSAVSRFSYLIHGLPKKPDRITVNGRNIVYFYEPTTNTIIFKISAGVTDIQIFFP
jgi:alpha-glucosidase